MRIILLGLDQLKEDKKFTNGKTSFRGRKKRENACDGDEGRFCVGARSEQWRGVEVLRSTRMSMGLQARYGYGEPYQSRKRSKLSQGRRMGG